MTKVFYHSDLDGYCAGAIVKSNYPEARLFKIDYDIKFPWHIINKGETIYMVDFSLPLENMQKLNEMSDFVWIDHHSSIIEEADKAKFFPEGLRAKDFPSGCQLTWEWIYGNKEGQPTVVTLLGNYDIWDHSDPDVLPFQYAMLALDPDPNGNMDIWSYLFFINDENEFANSPYSVATLLEKGKSIKQYLDVINKKFAEKNVFTVQFEGHSWAACNHPSGGSVLTEFKADPAVHVGSLVFGVTGKKRWKVSLYSYPDVRANCGEIAKKYGGGGHDSAAGFEIDKLPFEIKSDPKDTSSQLKYRRYPVPAPLAPPQKLPIRRKDPTDPKPDDNFTLKKIQRPGPQWGEEDEEL